MTPLLLAFACLMAAFFSGFSLQIADGRKLNRKFWARQGFSILAGGMAFAFLEARLSPVQVVAFAAIAGLIGRQLLQALTHRLAHVLNVEIEANDENSQASS